MATRTPESLSNDLPLRVRFDRFELDEAEARITADGEAMALPPKPFALLCALARTPQKLVTTNDLLDRVWGHRFVSESVLKSAISDVRAALQDDSRQPRYIETVSRRGYRFIARLSAPSATPVPALASSVADARAPDSTLTGRAHELERLRSSWQQARAGKRQIGWVAGEAGVGKTTLIEALIAEIGEVHCAHGHCVEQHGTGESYLPVLEALTALCRQDAALPALIHAVAPSWLFRLPWLCTPPEREALRAELSGAGEARMLREMGELLDRYTEDRPLLLVTEDLQWSDEATVRLIDYIARRRSSARLMWLASFRLTEVIAADHPFKSVRRELRLHGSAYELVLDAFSEAQVGEYVAQHAPLLAAEESFVRALHDRTDGLPLFVASVIDDLGAHAGTNSDAARIDGAWPIPDSLAGIVERYVEELRPEQRAALQVASVCGTEFCVSTIAQVLHIGLGSAAEVCADLARSQRWLKDIPNIRHGSTGEARYAFRHALYREVLFKRMGRIAGDELHRKIETLARREPLHALSRAV